MRNPPFALKALIGLVVTAVIAVAGFLGTRFAQGAFDEQYRIWVTLGETGQGVISGSDVVLRGVIVGEVGEIRLDDELRAVIELVLEPDLQVPEDATIAVTGKTLLGEKQIEIRPDGPLAEGPFIADGGSIDDPDQVVELQDVLSELDEVLGAIDPTDLAVLVDDGLGAFVGQDAQIA
uniref:MlaD family protein n=1 Tax=Euzebya sp. TaxID=1971409 RepID=UPI0035171682